MTNPSLSDAMLLAADTEVALNQRLGYPDNFSWSPSELRREAEHIAAEDKENAEREVMVEELAQAMYASGERVHTNLADATKDVRTWYLGMASEVIASGWRKDPAS